MVRRALCPFCGLQLPDTANFCARCGRPARQGFDFAGWMLPAMETGLAAGLAIGVVYVVAATRPSIQTDPGRLAGSIAIAVFGFSLALCHLFAVTGLLRRRRYGKIAASVACAGWSMTCLGAPLSFIVMVELWRPGGLGKLRG